MTAILSEMSDICLLETLTSIDDVIAHDAKQATAIFQATPLFEEIVLIANYATVRRAPVLVECNRRAAQDMVS